MKLVPGRIVTALALVTFAVLLTLQAAASLAVRTHAARGSWLWDVSATSAQRFDHVAPSLPLDALLRLVLARAAFARGDFSATRALLGRLPSSRDKLALQARLALAGGDVRGAAADAVAAGDPATVDDVTNVLVTRHAFAGALAVQRAAIVRFQADPTEEDALAEADFHLGRLEEMTAWRYPVASALRAGHEHASLAAYSRAAALGPFDERYLLALGNQALNVAQYGLARTTFVRAASVSPRSAEPFTGLGDLALRTGDRATAARQLARARRLNPQSAAVRRLAQALARPN